MIQRWKALEFLGKLEENNKETYGFKSQIFLKSVDELNQFEEDLMFMVKKVEVKSGKSGKGRL